MSPRWVCTLLVIRYTFGKVTRPTWSVCSVIVQFRSVLSKYTVYVKWRPRVCDLRVVTWCQKWPGIVVKTSWQARCSTARSRRTCCPTNSIFWSVPRWAHDGKIQSTKPSRLHGARKVARMASAFPAVPGSDQIEGWGRWCTSQHTDILNGSWGRDCV